jgi:hypothetical protein
VDNFLWTFFNRFYTVQEVFLYQIVVNKFHILNEFLYMNQTTKNITLDTKHLLTHVYALFKSSSVSSAISIAVCESTFGSKVTKSIFLFM